LVTRQLALPFPQTCLFSPAGFLPAVANADARAWLAAPATWPNQRLALHGPAGSGKTHLLHIFAAQNHAILMPGPTLRYLPDLPPDAPIAIDDADAAPDPETLLHLLNIAAERHLPLLLAGRTPPARWTIALPDLLSRLRATQAVALIEPDDALLRALLAQLIAARQLRVEEHVQAYLLARLPRTCAAMREAAACLDRISLAEGSRITRAIAAQVLARMQAGTAEDAEDEDFVPPGEEPSPLTPRLI
jgi:chromosomal replication initiation ATPase DnaA